MDIDVKTSKELDYYNRYIGNYVLAPKGKLMSVDDWPMCSNFSPREKWNRWDLMEFNHMLVLQRFRELLGCRVILSGVEYPAYAPNKGHCKNSEHYPIKNENGIIVRGSEAADIFPDCNLGRAFITASQMPSIGGLGVYPYWEYPKFNLQGGLHIGTRYMASPSQKRMWWGDEKGNTHNLWEEKNLKRLFTILHLQWKE